MVNQNYAYEKTILAIFENEELKNTLEKWAEEKDIKIFYGDKNSQDIIAVPSFALIIDRNIICDEPYKTYLDYAGESKEANLFIAFDDRTDAALPENEIVLKINPQNKNAVKWVIENIKIAKALT